MTTCQLSDCWSAYEGKNMQVLLYSQFTIAAGIYSYDPYNKDQLKRRQKWS